MKHPVKTGRIGLATEGTENFSTLPRNEDSKEAHPQGSPLRYEINTVFARLGVLDESCFLSELSRRIRLRPLPAFAIVTAGKNTENGLLSFKPGKKHGVLCGVPLRKSKIINPSSLSLRRTGHKSEIFNRTDRFKSAWGCLMAEEKYIKINE
ncbi:MAG: hypothetical protein JW947_06680 [Sedimentisphaerales bacterium]|nr:hypothetical protein [Sedimentisphaerales bacterium]